MAKLVTFGFVGEGIQNFKKTNVGKYKDLKSAAMIACNFWNGHINPNKNVVIQIGIFDEGTKTTTIARAWTPFEENGVLYGKVEFNANRMYWKEFMATVMMHEICHTLGFGWESLGRLYDKETGLFHQEFVNQIPELAQMKIELDYGPSTRYAHWDEETFGNELMTGFKNTHMEYVLPVTIKIMKLFGHEVVVFPEEKLKLNDKTIKKLSKIKFNRQKDVSLIDTLYEKETTIAEEHEFEVSWIDRLINFFK